MNRIVQLLLATVFASLVAVLVLNFQTAPVSLPQISAPLIPGGVGPESANGGNFVTSRNWSGYGAPGGKDTYTEVHGSWTVPAATCSTGNQFASLWVGIDGYNSNTVEQLGTDTDCRGNPVAPRYYAWYEVFPNPSHNIHTMTISVGDVISASVNYIGDNNYSLAIKDVTSGESFSIVQPSKHADRSSAEWVMESPATCKDPACNHFQILPLTDFGVAQFYDSGATYNGTPYTISDLRWKRINMVTKGGDTRAATAGLMPDGASFNVKWKHR